MQSPKHGGQLFNVCQIKLGFAKLGGSFLQSSRAAISYRCIHSEVGKTEAERRASSQCPGSLPGQIP